MNVKASVSNLENYKKYLIIKNEIVSFLVKKNYQELDLPVLSPKLIPESCLEVFQTEFRNMSYKQKLFLTPSPELFIKRLIADGIGDCFYLGKAFRNAEHFSSKHSFEFTICEFYKLNTDYMSFSKEVLDLFLALAKKVNGKNYIYFKGKKISFESFEKITVAQAFYKYASIKDTELFNHKAFLKVAGLKGYKTEGFSYEDLWSQIYAQEVEPNLGISGRPTLIYEYPSVFAPLAKPKNKKVSKRFEVYISGIEIGNCYDELNDYKLQRNRFAIEERLLNQSGTIWADTDYGFLEAVRKGLPNCSGIAIGVERLGMIFSDTHNINDFKLINFE